MEAIALPTKHEFSPREAGKSGTLVIEPLYPGYGTTIGNALRRVLLSSLPGGAITVQMEYYENGGAAVARLAWGQVGQEPPPPPTNVVGTVTANLLNVRSGPGLNYSVIGALTRGEQVRLLGRNSAATWLSMETSAGFRGWVSARYIRSSTPLADLPTLP